MQRRLKTTKPARRRTVRRATDGLMGLGSGRDAHFQSHVCSTLQQHRRHVVKLVTANPAVRALNVLRPFRPSPNVGRGAARSFAVTPSAPKLPRCTTFLAVVAYPPSCGIPTIRPARRPAGERGMACEAQVCATSTRVWLWPEFCQKRLWKQNSARGMRGITDWRESILNANVPIFGSLITPLQHLFQSPVPSPTASAARPPA
jgi:hypothetical protein